MRILVVSHNVFSKTSNMGKTLISYFKEMTDTEIAQFYIHSEVPTVDMCQNYYRITDIDAIKSVFSRKSGTVFTRDDICYDLPDARTDTGKTAALYQKARKRNSITYFLRNTWWNLGKWKTKKLSAWLDEFSPDIVFFASGDYSFMYKIALDIARSRGIPLVVSCMDDYYFQNKNEKSFMGRLLHKRFMKQVRKTMEYASCIYPICEKMGREYGEFFSKPYHVLHTASSFSDPIMAQKNNAISYIGNLGYQRNEQLIKLGKALRLLDIENKPQYIDVYSAEQRPEILAGLIEENGIRFHGSISADQVLEVMGRSMAVIHTESFDENMQRMVGYSVSTKIADSLASGTCMLAYGPAGIASIEYLIKHDVAFCATNEKDIPEILAEMIQNSQLREEKIANALAMAKQNHDPKRNCEMLRESMRKFCENF